MNLDETIQEITKVFESRRHLYNEISLRTAFARENGVWTNLITIILPVNKPVINRRKLDYGDFIILETTIRVEELPPFLEEFSVNHRAQIDTYLIEFEESEVQPSPVFSMNWGNYFIPALGAGDIERLGVKWPSKAFMFGNVQQKSLPEFPFLKWVQKGLPSYLSILSAIENELSIVGFTSTPYYLAKVAVILPDYRARFTKIVMHQSSVTVHLETSRITDEKLFLKYMNNYPLIEEHPNTEIPVTSSSAIIQLKNPPFSFYCYLVNEMTEVIDVVRYDEHYGHFSRDWIEYDEPEDRIGYLASLGENQILEYKKEVGKKDEFLESIVAFANTNDGTILLGVDDHGNVVGCANAKKEDIEQSCRDRIQPFVVLDIRELKYDNRPVMIISVQRGDDGPYYLKSNGKLIPYVRRNASDVAMRYDEIEDVYRQKFANGNAIRYG
jgi:ATP-dependent DNA helicase RecG